MNLWRLRENFLDLLNGIGTGEIALIDDAVGLMDVLNGFSREATTAQADEVNARITDRLLAGNNKWRNVLREAASTLYHHVRADVAELVAEHNSRNDGEIVDGYFSGKLGGVANDAAVAYHAIVSDVHVLHEQVVVAHDGGSLGSCTARDSYVLTDGVVVADLASGDLALELQVLRLCGKTGACQHLVAVSDACALINSDAILEHVVIADNDVAVDIAEGADDVARA